MVARIDRCLPNPCTCTDVAIAPDVDDEATTYDISCRKCEPKPTNRKQRRAAKSKRGKK